MLNSTRDGFRLMPGRLGAAEQTRLLGEVLKRVRLAPFVSQITPGGRAMSVRTTSFGDLGWCSDARGYSYQPRQPGSGAAWPDIPEMLLDLWSELADSETRPDSCLVNFYGPSARLGLHQDRDEADFRHPVLSVSLGDTAVFRMGGLRRSDATGSVRLMSGDVCLLSGASRLLHHGVDRVLPGSSRLIPGGGRINLTLRRAAA